MTQRWLVALGVGVWLFGAIAEVRADDIGPPPSDCPRGSVGHSSHSGEWCAIQPCQSDADCKNMVASHRTVQGTCESTSLCVAKKTIPAHHRVVSDAEPSSRKIAVAVGTCGITSSCKPDAQCEKAMRCVAPMTFATPSTPSAKEAGRGCGCGKSTGPKSSALLGLAVGAWLLRRRKDRG